MKLLKNGLMFAGFATMLISAGKANAVTITNFATGYDNNTNTLIPVSNNDPDWLIISAPQGVILGAAKVDAEPAWFNPAPQARWLVPKLASGSTYLWDTPGGKYVFEYNFNVEKVLSNLSLAGAMGVDNHVSSIKLNGNSVAFNQPADIYARFEQPFAISFSTDNQSFFNSGLNSLQVEMINWNSSWGGTTPGGLVIRGEVTGTPSKSVPESSNVLGLFLVLGAGGISYWRKQQQKVLESPSAD